MIYFSLAPFLFLHPVACCLLAPFFLRSRTQQRGVPGKGPEWQRSPLPCRPHIPPIARPPPCLQATKKKQAEAFVPEEEEEGAEGQPAAAGGGAAAGEGAAGQQEAAAGPSADVATKAAASVHRLEAEGEESGGLQVRQRPAPPRAAAAAAGAAQPAAAEGQPSAYQARRAQIAAALAAQKGAAGGDGGAQAGAGAAVPEGGLGHNKDVAAQAQVRGWLAPCLYPPISLSLSLSHNPTHPC